MQNTYVYGSDSASNTTAAQSTAATTPFTIRNRPAWLYHNNNRVINPGADANSRNVVFWLKTGYIGKDSSLGFRLGEQCR